MRRLHRRFSIATQVLLMQCVLVLKRLNEGERHSKTELNQILRDHGID